MNLSALSDKQASTLREESFSLLNMNTLYERLMEICRDRGINAPKGVDIQALTGLSSGRVTQIKNEGAAARLSGKTITQLHGLGYSVDWLGEGRGPKHTGALAVIEPSNVSAGPDRRARVPLISWVQAGDWSHVADLLHPGEAEEWIDTSVTVRPHTFALRVEGDSMEPEFVAGTILVVEPEMDAHPGDYVVAKNGADEATFKQLVRDGADFYLKPLNPRYPIKPLGSARVIGVVREAVKRYR